MPRAILLFLALLPLASQCQPAYRYFRAGNPANVTIPTHPGFALMGGGKDLDEAFRFLCDHAPGGDLLILRASGDNDYNPYLQKLCRLNSVATLILPNRAAANDPFAEQAIRHAGILFIAGGDQANYINFWQGTPVQSALNDAIARGVPLGGTSAGLAVLGEYAYTAQGDKPDDPNLDARTALADPYGPRITLTQGFLDIPLLKNVITDSHFAKRNRMGRLLVFLARLNHEHETPAGQPQAGPAAPSQERLAAGSIRGIGIEERAAVLLDADGMARVAGNGSAYFVDTGGASGTPERGQPVTFAPFQIQKVAPGHSFNVKSWSGESTPYQLSVHGGNIQSTQTGGALY